MVNSSPYVQVFDVQRFSVHDGPGIRTTIFFQGCPLRCAWCQNPESQRAERQLLLYADLCIDCDACVHVCPELKGEQTWGSGTCPATCTVCGRCVDLCPTGTRRIAGREATIDELLELALRDKPFYGTEGGVTFGGGEPLAQWDAARTLADGLRDEGVHVAIDTACVASPSAQHEVPDHVDLVLADLKGVWPEEHRYWTGADNAHILETIRHWSREMPGRLWVSVPLIPGVHGEAEIARTAQYVSSLANRPPVRLIPYHRLGERKYAALGRDVPQFAGEVEPLIEAARSAFEGLGVRVLERR